MMERGLSPVRALRLGIVNKCFDSYEQTLVSDLVATRLPESLEAGRRVCMKLSEFEKRRAANLSLECGRGRQHSRDSHVRRAAGGGSSYWNSIDRRGATVFTT